MAHTGQVWSGSWSPDGTRIASGSTDDTTRIWDATTGAELLTLPTPSNWEVSVAWSPDGQYLAVSTNSFDVPGKAEVWRVWQSTEELIQYARDCCVFRELTPEERAQFGLVAEP
jgi:WD40 repeat protein